MRQLLLVFVMLPMTLLAGRPALACGSIEMLTRMYLHGNSYSRSRAITWLAGAGCGKPSIVMLTYRGAASDKMLLAILRDAARRPRWRRQAARIFYDYRCLPGARSAPGFAEVLGALKSPAKRGQRCPTDKDLRRWLVAKRASELHRRPDAGSTAVGLVRAGNVVTGLGRAGGWAKVRSWRGQTGWMPRDWLGPYRER